jgi:hypothetical protein
MIGFLGLFPGRITNGAEMKMPARFCVGTFEFAATEISCPGNLLSKDGVFAAPLIKSARIISEIAIQRVLCITLRAIAGCTLVLYRLGLQVSRNCVACNNCLVGKTVASSVRFIYSNETWFVFMDFFR